LSIASFDGLDNRRDLLALLARLGHGLPERQAMMRRARFLRSLLPASETGFAGRPVTVTPCTALEAFHLFLAITSALGVPIETAAGRLEEEVRRDDMRR
jgi:hypothetical protein